MSQIEKALTQPQKKPCRLEKGELVDCSDPEVLDWGRPLIMRLNDAIDRNMTAVQARHQQFDKDHNEQRFNDNKILENIDMNRFLERDFDNLVTYRAALVSHLRGGDPSNGGVDPVRSLLFGSVDHGQSGRLILSDGVSMASQVELVLMDFQDLSNRLGAQVAQDLAKHSPDSLRKRALDLSSEILAFLLSRQANEPPAPTPSTSQQDAQNFYNYQRQTIALYSERFAGKVIAIREEFATQGFTDPLLDSSSRYPDSGSTADMRPIAERIGALAQELKE